MMMKFDRFLVLVVASIVIIGMCTIAPNFAQAKTPIPTITPTELTATAVSPTQINLSWNAPTQNYGKTIIGYKIEQMLLGGSFYTIFENTGSPITTYSLTGLKTGTTYTYRVSAVYSDDTHTDPSNVASATPTLASAPPPTPPPSSPITNVKFDFTPSDGTTLTSVIITQSDYQQLIVIKDPRSLISNVMQTAETINNDLVGLLKYQTIHSPQETTQQTYNYTPPPPNNTTNPSIGLLWGVATSVIAFGVIGIITWLVKTKIAKKISKEHYFTLEKFIEDGIQLIRIRNSGQTIEDCIILCNGEVCIWTDTKIDKPRHVHEGSISTVRLPEKYEDNSLISVKSGKKVLKKIQLGDMAHG